MNAVRDTTGRERQLLDDAIERLNEVVLGKDREIRLCIACLLARGHLLIEDIPGVGKTILAHALARVLGLTYQRVQFTSDLLPADIIGVSIYDRGTGEFQFRHGPVFAQLVLADESGEPVAIIDSRPSDSIALALRAKCPLRVAESAGGIIHRGWTAERALEALSGPAAPAP